jgi:beta-lactamase superfamily II metal-dependent hydrolase
MKNIFITESLTLDVYIIGYKKQGESIILIVKSDGLVSYTCIIDCYEYKKINKTIQILENLGISDIDTICWTHPDIDHSIGIDNILSKYANEKTTILIPEGLDGDRESVNYHKRVRRTFELINDDIKSSKHSSFRVMSASDCKPIVDDLYTFKEKSYSFYMISMSPNSHLIRRRALYTSEPKKNDYSIALRVKFGDLELFFGGDIEDVNIDLIKKYLSSYIPSSFHLLKIPHHTSSSSKNLLQLLDISKKSDISCSTVYRSSKLPDTNVIDLYKAYSKRFYCTGYVIDKYDNDDYGCIHINYNILQKKAEVKLDGNVNKVFENHI